MTIGMSATALIVHGICTAMACITAVFCIWIHESAVTKRDVLYQRHIMDVATADERPEGDHAGK